MKDKIDTKNLIYVPQTTGFEGLKLVSVNVSDELMTIINAWIENEK